MRVFIKIIRRKIPFAFQLTCCLFILSPFNAVANETITPVSVVTAKTGEIRQEVPLTGTVTSPRISMISPKYAGYIETVFVDEGDIVKKGDVLLSLDKQLAKIEVARVQAQLQEALAQVREYERQRDEAEELVRKKHIAATTFEGAQAQVDIGNAVVKRLRAELQRQQVIIERHHVYAPFDGVVVQKLIEIGQWVDSNRSLYELVELNPLRIEVPVPQFYFNRVIANTSVKIRYDAIPNETFTALISKLIPVSDNTARTFTIFIEVDNEKLMITPGMSARVILQIGEAIKSTSLLIPRDAIVQQPDGRKSVWVVTGENNEITARPVDVKTGKNVSNNVEITQGDLTDGDVIIVKGNELLQPGQNVNVIESLDYSL